MRSGNGEIKTLAQVTVAFALAGRSAERGRMGMGGRGKRERARARKKRACFVCSALDYTSCRRCTAPGSNH
jgi:hypothetical protein